MTSFQQLDKVVDFVLKHKLPNKILIYCENEDDLKNKLSWIHDFCASGITSCSFASGEIEEMVYTDCFLESQLQYL